MQTQELVRNHLIQNHRSKLDKWKKASNLDDKYDAVTLNKDNPVSQSVTGPLRITFIMNHVRVCGGAKIVLEQANRLVERNHQVSIVCKHPEPDWMKVKADYIQAPLQSELSQCIPETDVIICTVIDQVLDCYLSQKAPVVMFEQGDTYLFEFEKLDRVLQNYLKDEWSLPVPVISVSKGLSKVIETHFQKNCMLLPNAIDRQLFYPKSHGEIDNRAVRILMVGQEEARFKRIDTILKALQKVRNAGRDFETVWVSQTRPSIPFHGELIVNPSQEVLGEIYRSCDIYISASEYESFCLPALEAMSSGCAVISTNHAGIQEYGIHETNCLIADIGDTDQIAEYVMRLIDSPNDRSKLVENGYTTAREFDWEKTINILETYLCSVIGLWRGKEEIQKRDTLLRIETLPSHLTRSEAIETINRVQQNMQEEWCLWLIEGEKISPKDIDLIKRIVRSPIDSIYSLQVVYSDDVPEHPIVRKENRLLKRGELFLYPSMVGEALSLQIKNASTSYFIPEWVETVRCMYMQKQFLPLIEFIKERYSKLDLHEQPVALKYLSLSLIELEAFVQVTQLLYDAIQIHDLSSDLRYLYARVALILGEYELSASLLKLAKETGTSFLLPEWFDNIEDTVDMYLNALEPTD